MKVSILISSIYNIDLTSCLFFLIENPTAELKVYLKDDVEIVEDSYKRLFVSRLALPTFKWHYCQNEINVKSTNDKCWRQLHVPIENIKSESSEILKSYSRFLGFDKSILRRIKEILIILDQADNPLEGYKNCIKEIINKITDCNIECEYATNFRRNLTNVVSFFDYLKSILIKNNKRIVKFVKGGKVQIFHIETGDNYNINRLELFDNELFFKSNDKTFSIHNFCNSNYQINILGPIETLFFIRDDYLGHLPYYLDANFSSSGSTDYEYISPSSVASKKRVSKKVFGKGHRLDPSGSSLLEYDSTTILAFLRNFFSDISIKSEDLDDWIHFINNFPLSKKKLAEHQKEVKAYIDIFSKSINSKFLKSIIPDIEILENNKINTSFVNYGKYLLDMLGFLNLIKSSINPKNQIKLSKLASESFNNIIDFSNYSKKLDKIVSDLYKKLDDLGFSDDLTTPFLNFKEKLKRAEDIVIDLSKSTQNFERWLVVTNLQKELKFFLIEYYSFVGFFTNTILKASIFNMYIFFGEKSKEKVNSLISRRKKRHLKYFPVYFEFE